MDAAPPWNALLRAISARDWLDLRSDLQDFSLIEGDVLTEVGDNVGWVVFPETGLISLSSILISGQVVETAVVGRESAACLIEALGSGIAQNRLLVRISGKAFRIKSDAFKSAFRASPALQRAVLGQIELFQAQAHLEIACRSVHDTEQRLCRWLLELRGVVGDHTPSADPTTHFYRAGCSADNGDQICDRSTG